MKDHVQTIINVCFAISITAFIYQNDKQQDRIDTLEGYAQLDTDSTWDEIDKLKEDLSDLESRYSYTTESLNKWQVVLDNELSQRITNTENIDILFKNDNEFSKKNFDLLFEAVKFNEERIIDNRRAIRDLAEITIR
ncbi:MAG: hypothetical protein ACJ0FL_00045 [Gammaproteobacteria bacterium]